MKTAGDVCYLGTIANY